MKDKIKLAVIIPTFNRVSNLDELLTQLHNQNLDEIVLKIVVINDGSSDGTSELLSIKYPNVKEILGNGNWWFTKCVNEGLRSALDYNPNYFLLLNDDLIINENYIATLINDAKSLSETFILGSITLTSEEPKRVFYAGSHSFNKWRVKYFDYLPESTKIKVEDLSGIKYSIVLSGRGMLICREVITRIGLFNEKLVQYGSDDEFCLRAQNAGIKVFISWNAKIFSHHKMTGIGTPFIKQSFLFYLSSIFNKYSKNNWTKSYIIYKNIYPKVLLPGVLLVSTLGDIYSFMRNRKIK